LSWNYERPSSLISRKQVRFLEATVSKQRVVWWLGTQLLFALSGVLLLWAQGRCHRRVVVDAAAALMMDPGAMLKRDTNLSNLSYITPEDAKLGRLRLEFPTASVARFKLGVGGHQDFENTPTDY
jgi:hypothetical protein